MVNNFIVLQRTCEKARFLPAPDSDSRVPSGIARRRRNPAAGKKRAASGGRCFYAKIGVCGGKYTQIKTVTIAANSSRHSPCRPKKSPLAQAARGDCVLSGRFPQTRGVPLPKMNERTTSTKATPNTILAKYAAVPAIPLNPKNAATRAISRKMIAHLNIRLPP